MARPLNQAIPSEHQRTNVDAGLSMTCPVPYEFGSHGVCPELKGATVTITAGGKSPLEVSRESYTCTALRRASRPRTDMISSLSSLAASFSRLSASDAGRATLDALRGTGRFIFQELPEAASEAFEAAGNAAFHLRQRRKPRAFTLVAEGDSWFDFKPSWLSDHKRGDLLAQLNDMAEFNIFRVSQAGDTIENMVYGTGVTGDNVPEPPQLDETLSHIARLGPVALLFSGGGNDITGPSLEGYLHHAASPQAAGSAYLREDLVRFTFETYHRAALEHLIRRVRSVSPGLPIFFHGYDYARPTGKGVSVVPNGWSFVGPWMRPYFAAKRIPADAEQGIVRRLVDALNAMLSDLAAAHEGVHYIDLRGTLATDADWSDELHPTPAGFAKVAARFRTALLENLPPQLPDGASPDSLA